MPSRKPVLTVCMLLLASLVVGGCGSWRVETMPPAELVSGPTPPGTLRVTRQSGDQVTLTSPRVMGDSLMGFHAGRTVGVELADIRELATRHAAPGKALGLIFGTAGVVALTLMIIASSGFHGLGG